MQVEELFTQHSEGEIDILFVVDSSDSMLEEQAALMAGSWNFFQHVVDGPADYRVAVTAVGDCPDGIPPGQLRCLVDNHTPDPVNAFTQCLTAGCGDADCRPGLATSLWALTATDDPLGDFYRQSARLILVIVSDRADASDPGSGCAEYDVHIGYTEFLPWLSTLKGSQSLDRLHFVAIVGDDPNGCSSAMGDATAGRGYLEVVDGLQDAASFFSVCEQDWAGTMDTVGQLAHSLRTSFGLTGLPNEGSLRVTLDPDGPHAPMQPFQIFEDPTLTTDYAYVYNRVSNSLDFSHETLPPAGAELRVTYYQVEEAW